MLIDKTLAEFLEETAGDSPVPGGGSIAAQSGAAAAALVEMVAVLTLGKKSYEDVYVEMSEIAAQASALRGELLKDIDRDSDAYARVIMAYKMPKETDADKQRRTAEIQSSMKQAATVPLAAAGRSAQVLNLAKIVVVKGNKNAITDGAVAGMLARTAALSAIYNVKINLGSIKDADFVGAATLETDRIKAEVTTGEEEIFRLMQVEGL